MLKDKGILQAIWAGMFILCGVLGFLPPQEGANRVLLVILAVLFFAAPGWLIWVSFEKKDTATLKRVRLLSVISLAGTLVLLVANMMSVLAPGWLGDLLYYVLVIVSTPMICGHYWVLSLGLWAALLWGSILALKRLPA